jgi:hypothetical protein
MGFIRVVKPEDTPHTCEPPPLLETRRRRNNEYRYGAGTIWQCDICHEYWKVVPYTVATGTPLEKDYLDWRRVTLREALPKGPKEPGTISPPKQQRVTLGSEH